MTLSLLNLCFDILKDMIKIHFTVTSEKCIKDDVIEIGNELLKYKIIILYRSFVIVFGY
jgi:hypothetical protein